MSWKIRVSSNGERYFRKLDRKLRKRINNALIKLSKFDNPIEHPQVKPLTGDLRGFYRFRVGHYRMVFGLLEESRIIAVVNIFPRGDAY